MSRISWIFILVIFSMTAGAASNWDNYVDKKAPSDEMPLIVNRAVLKDGKLQLSALAGFSDRNDLYAHKPISMWARYHFSEHHAWEVLKVNYDLYSISGVASDVIQKTGYVLDGQQAFWSLSTGYVFTPIYGKYAFSDAFLVHMEMYVGADIGARFPKNGVQVMIEPLIGITHYVTPRLGIILPEVRARFYQEARTSGSVTVSELVVQAGLSWLF